MQTRGLIKQFLWRLLPLFLITGAIVVYVYTSEVQNEKTGREANETLNIELGRVAISLDLEAAVSDLMVLAQHRELVEMDGSLKPQAMQSLAQELLVFSREKRLYDQVRFLDLKGMETIRIDFNDDHPKLVHKSKLQNKSKRYYFRDTLRLKKREVFVSPLDLNIERGKVEKPLKPMIRLGTPVFDSQGRKRGVVVLNYFASRLIGRFENAVAGIADHAMILCADGYWLHSPNPEQEWGFMLDHGHRFKDQFPEAWERISKADSGQFYDSEGLFTFDTVYPLLEGWKSVSGVSAADEPSYNELSGNEYYWKVVARVPNETIYAAARKTAGKLMWIAGPLFVLLAMGSWGLAIARAQRLEVVAALRESEAKFRTLFESSNDAIMILDKDSFLDCNQATLEMFACKKREEFIGKHPSEISPPLQADGIESRIAADERIAQAYQKGKNIFEWTYGRANDGDFPAEVLLTPMVLGGQQVLQAIVRDITERKRTDAQLHLQASALKAAADGIVITDRDGSIQWANPAYAQLTGYSVDEAIGRNPRILKSGKQDRAFYKKLWDTILAGRTWHGELWNKRKDGNLYLEEESITPVLDLSGNIGHFIAIKRDITERKRVEGELARFKSTLDKTLDCVFMFEPESLQFFYVNQGAVEQVGYSHDTMLQMTPIDIKPKFNEVQFRKMIAPLIAGPDHTSTFETVHQHKDGHHIPVEIFLQYVHTEGEPSRFVAFVRDITERQQLHRQLQQAQKMEAIGQLTGGIAHDFNNMLTAVIGYTELADEEIAPYKNEKITKYLGHVHKSGKRAQELVAQMLAFSRGGEGALKPLMLSPLIKESLTMLGSILPSSIEIDLQLGDDDLTVMTEPVQLHQLVMNLCINARDVMEGKGKITIGLLCANGVDTECRSCHERIRGDYIKLFVRDTGCGIKPEQLDRIFDPFYTTKEVGKGSGMGLSIVHGIMHDHGGHILVETGTGKGTTFTLLFPVIDAQVDTVNLEDNDTEMSSE